MRRFIITATALCFALGTVTTTDLALAAPRHDAQDNNGPSHSDWRKGGHIEKNDWNRGQHVDYRSHHLQAPPRGYEWRQVDGNYVLAAAATGLIASVLAVTAGR